MENNFLNFPKKDIDKPIFRIIPIDRLFELFEKKVNILVSPELWEDPFENFIMNSKVKFQSGISLGLGFRKNLYGQCWSQTRENDALWRIYSPEKKGVRITTTSRKLLYTLKEYGNPEKNKNCFIGKVQYYNTKELLKILDQNGANLIFDESGVGHAQSLLFKRVAFEHENEVRLIYNSFNRFEHTKIGFEIDPFDLIDDIVFDPRLEYKVFKPYKDKLREIGFNKRIVRSNLYRIPELEIQL